MIGVIGAEMAIAAVELAVFVAVYLRSRWWHSPLGRWLMALAVVLLGGVVSLLVLLVGVHPPLWLYAAGFGLLDVVWAALLWQLVKAQRQGGLPHVDG